MAFRNYQRLGSIETLELLEQNKKTTPAKEGDIKFYYWYYWVEGVLEDGTPYSEGQFDFHVVAGVVGPGGKDPTSVFSKNGARKVHGPQNPEAWKPKEKSQYLSNDRYETPVTYSGQKVYVLRTNIALATYILPCKNY